jgi:polyhydroxyalkanoate synthesis regulator phasin
MSKTILAEVDGFTPVIDILAKEHGLVRAAVFGRMWRFCQLSDGVCKASLETIAEGLGIDKATVMRHADGLSKNGYLEDLTPELRNKPHTYRDTGKAGLKMSLGVAGCNATVAGCNMSVAESQLKKVLKKVNEDTDINTSEAKEPASEDIRQVVRCFNPDKEEQKPTKKQIRKKEAERKLYPWANEIANLCGLVLNNGANGECFRAAKLLVGSIGAPRKPIDLHPCFAKGGKIYHEWPWNNGTRLKPMDIPKHWPRLSGAIKQPSVHQSRGDADPEFAARVRAAKRQARRESIS